MNVKISRLEHEFTVEIAKIIHDEVRDKKIGFVSITGAKISNDLSYAKIYFTTLDNNKKVALEALNNASSFIRTLLASRVDIRKMPKLNFVYDTSVEYGEKIEKIIEKIDKEEK